MDDAAVSATGRFPRGARARETREAILTTAERLFARYGVVAVSNRQISDEAGQGNNTAVGYHFGTKTDLVRAIVHKHTAQIEDRAGQLLDRYGGSAEVRDWVTCLVLPLTDHLAAQHGPSWYARFCAQVMTDPVLRQAVLDDALGAGALQATVEGLHRCLPDLPPEVRAARGDMARYVLLHTCAERERAPRAGSSWAETATMLIDAIVGLLTAPVTRP
jgi:AcrR family transcriptional regulator